MSPLRIRVVAVVAALAVIASSIGIAAVVILDAGNGSSSNPPPGSSTFEQLLRLVPRTPETIASVEMIDVGRAYSAMGVELPGRRLDEGEVDLFGERVTEAAAGSGVTLDFLVTRLYQYTLVGGMARPSRIGYSMAEVSGHVYAGRQRDAFAEERAYEAVTGLFDERAVSRAIAVCDDCGITPELLSHSGANYVAWGEDFRNHLLKLWAAPAFDSRGKGGRLVATDEYVMRANWSEGIEAMIDAEQDGVRSLADDPYFVSVARALDSNSVILAYVTCASYSIDAVRRVIATYATSETQAAYEFERWVQPALPALRPFLLTGTGTGYERGEEFVVVVLVHATRGDAVENARRLRMRLEKGTNTRGTPWTRLFTSIKVKSEGNLVIARLGGSSGYHMFEYESLLIRGD